MPPSIPALLNRSPAAIARVVRDQSHVYSSSTENSSWHTGNSTWKFKCYLAQLVELQHAVVRERCMRGSEMPGMQIYENAVKSPRQSSIPGNRNNMNPHSQKGQARQSRLKTGFAMGHSVAFHGINENDEHVAEKTLEQFKNLILLPRMKSFRPEDQEMLKRTLSRLSL